MDQNLKVETIKAILLAKFLSDSERSDRVVRMIQEEMNIPVVATSILDMELKINVIKKMAAIISERLVAGDRAVPILSIEDFDELFSNYIDAKVAGETDIDEENRIEMSRVAMASLRNTFNYFVEQANGGKDPYDEYWRVVNVVKNLANDEMLDPGKPLTEELYDEVIRRLLTREQYIAQFDRLSASATDPDEMVSRLIEPVMKEMGDDPNLPEILEEMKNELRPQLMALASIGRKVMIDEVDRLYAQ